MTTFRWSSTELEPDDIQDALQRVNAVKSGDATNYTRYQLGDCQVELLYGSMPALLINGPTRDSVREAAHRLGYGDTGTVIEVGDEVRAR